MSFLSGNNPHHRDYNWLFSLSNQVKSCLAGPVWTLKNVLNNFLIYAVAYGNGVFVVSGRNKTTNVSECYWTADLGNTFNICVGLPASAAVTYTEIVFNGTYFFVCISSATPVYYSLDGKTFNVNLSLINNLHMTSVANNYAFQLDVNGDGSPLAYGYTNGVVYQVRGNILPASIGYNCFAAYFKGLYVIVGENGACYSNSIDGPWTAANVPAPQWTTQTGADAGIATDGNILIVASLSGANYSRYYYTLNGVDWNISALPLTNTGNQSDVQYLQKTFFIMNRGRNVLYTSPDGLTFTQSANLLPAAPFGGWKIASNGKGDFLAVSGYANDPSSIAYGKC